MTTSADEAIAAQPGDAPAGPAPRGSRPSAERWRRWNNLHRGRDIYLVGASPQLARLSEQELAGLRDCVTIGGNNTFYRVPQLSHFISSYPQEVRKAAYHLPSTELILLRAPNEKPMPGVQSLVRLLFDEDVGLPRYMNAPVPAVYSHGNQALAMMHLALVMGAARIIFIGVEQNDYAYFWQYDDALKARMASDLARLKGEWTLDDDSRKYFSAAETLLAANASDREKMPFYSDFEPQLTSYVDQARRHGVDVVCTATESVVLRAGARHQSLGDCLASEGRPEGRGSAAAFSAAASTKSAPTSHASEALLTANLSAPTLISGLGCAGDGLARRLIETGSAVTPFAASGRLSEACLGDWAKVDRIFRFTPPAADYPEPLVERLGRRPDLFEEIARRLRAHPDAADRLAPPGSPAAAAFWRSSFDLALFRIWASLNPRASVIHFSPARPLELAERLHARFWKAVEATPGVERLDKSRIAVDGRPARPGDFLCLTPTAGRPPVVVSQRCSTRAGALTLVQLYDHIALRLAGELGGERVRIVADPGAKEDLGWGLEDPRS